MIAKAVPASSNTSLYTLYWALFSAQFLWCDESGKALVSIALQLALYMCIEKRKIPA